MAEPSLSQVFGAGATQTASSISISKADLAAVGLTASASNTAESLLVAILLLAKNYLTETAFEANSDQSITILPGFNSIVQRSNGSGGFSEYRQFQFQFNAHKLDSAVLDPDDL
jgi:hypothetical protein